MNEKERTLFCGNLSDKVTEDILYELFLQAGPLEGVSLPKDKDGRRRNFGFVTFKHAVSVQYSVALMNGITLFGKPLKLDARTGAECEPNPFIETLQMHRKSFLQPEHYDRGYRENYDGNHERNYDRNYRGNQDIYSHDHDRDPFFNDRFGSENRMYSNNVSGFNQHRQSPAVSTFDELRGMPSMHLTPRYDDSHNMPYRGSQNYNSRMDRRCPW